MKKNKIRFAEPSDAKYLLEIYSPYVLNTSITFEVKVPELAEFRNRISEILSFYPYLVCEVDDKIVGYAYAQRYLERDAYGWSAKLSVYVKKEFCKNYHIGTALYTALKQILKLQNIQNLYGLVADTNTKSFALHKKIGFEKIATYNKIGYKFDKWHDVAIFEMNLGNHQIPVDDVVSVKDIPVEQLNYIMEECQKMIKTID